MRVVAALLAIALAAAVGLFLFAYAGLYNVAATRPHFEFTRWMLEFGMHRSVKFHAAGIAAPPLDDPALVQRGFRHFESACAVCHGAPGTPPRGIGKSMRPPAPELSVHAAEWKAGEPFWIVKHGIKMTGMPAWEAQERDDEVWAVVAFLRVLRGMTAEDYQAMSRVELPAAEASPDAGYLIALAGPPGRAETACVRCHGMDGAGPDSGAFPRLSGQDEAYFYESMKAYASGARPSGIMGPIARSLTDSDMRKVAAYYATVENARMPPRLETNDLALLQKGGALAAAGAPERGIEPCVACHGSSRERSAPGRPFLAGQHRGYLEQQLVLWKTDRRGDPQNVMARIAKQMSDEEIEAAAIYFASLPAQSRAESEMRSSQQE